MTNKDKYLKDGVDVCDLAREIWFNYKKENHNLVGDIIAFFNKSVTPTLTEDEKVILRHLDKNRYDKIGRDENGQLYLKFTGENGWLYETYFPNDFKSLQPRRRI